MPTHQETRFLPYPPDKLFDLVADIESYPEFLPWCVGARVLKREGNVVTADGTTIKFTPPPNGPPAVVLPQDRVFSREYKARLPAKVSAEFFRRLLAGRGFDVDSASSSSDSFTARRK